MSSCIGTIVQPGGRLKLEGMESWLVLSEEGELGRRVDEDVVGAEVEGGFGVWVEGAGGAEGGRGTA